MRHMAKKTMCMVTGCQNKRGRARGLCMSCYNGFLAKVHAREVTWRELEARGKVLAPRMRVSKLDNYLAEDEPVGAGGRE
jgi:hypothetical protein